MINFKKDTYCQFLLPRSHWDYRAQIFPADQCVSAHANSSLISWNPELPCPKVPDGPVLEPYAAEGCLTLTGISSLHSEGKAHLSDGLA